MDKLNLLKPKVKELALLLVLKCEQAGSPIVVTQTFRSYAEQDALYARGRTKPGPIITNAQGVYSFHNFGVAFDVCPIIGGRLIWNNNALFDSIGAIGQSIGLEWGGSWPSFPDRPHFQYLAGYVLSDFRNNNVDLSKFEIAIVTPLAPIVPIASPVNLQPQFKPMSVKVDVLNIRNGIGAQFDKIGQLTKGAVINPLDQKNGWYEFKTSDGKMGWVCGDYLI